MAAQAGQRNLITDVAGILVGQAEDRAAISGTTVVLAEAPAVASVDVRGGAPGGRETELLAPGTLVAVKFGPQQDGGDVAREVSVLAVPGARFTFVGIITAVDLRLGLLVLTSSIDHKTYEISFDPSLVPVDDNLRPGSDVTVLTRFDGSRYVARSVALNSQNQR